MRFELAGGFYTEILRRPPRLESGDVAYSSSEAVPNRGFPPRAVWNP